MFPNENLNRFGFMFADLFLRFQRDKHVVFISIVLITFQTFRR